MPINHAHPNAQVLTPKRERGIQPAADTCPHIPFRCHIWVSKAISFVIGIRNYIGAWSRFYDAEQISFSKKRDAQHSEKSPPRIGILRRLLFFIPLILLKTAWMVEKEDRKITRPPRSYSWRGGGKVREGEYVRGGGGAVNGRRELEKRREDQSRRRKRREGEGFI